MSEPSERSVPYYCPYCGGEDLRPHEEAHTAWACRECTRVFVVRLVGLVVGEGRTAPGPVGNERVEP